MASSTHYNGSVYDAFNTFGVTHSLDVHWFRSKVVCSMVQKKLRLAFEKEWKRTHGSDWDSETDAVPLIKSLAATASGINGRVPKEEQLFYLHQPTELWPPFIFCLVLMHLMLADRTTSDPQLALLLVSCGQWQSADFAFSAAITSSPASKAKIHFEKFYVAVSPVLASLGFSATEITAVMTQTDFSPQAGADSGNQAFQQRKGDGNKAFGAKDFSGALSHYTAALQLPNLSADSRAILLANSSICHLELGEYILAIEEAKKALVLFPVWFKPMLWLFRASNSLGQCDAILDNIGYCPNAFPMEWRERLELELKKMLRRGPPLKHSAAKPVSVGQSSDWIIGMERSKRSATKMSRIGRTVSPSGAGPVQKLRERCFDMIFDAEDFYHIGTASPIEAIAMAAQAVLLGRGLILPVTGVLANLAKEMATDGGDESRENMIVRIVGSLGDVTTSLQICDEALRRWPTDWWMLEARALIKASSGDLAAGIYDITKAIEFAPGDDITLQWFQGIFTWRERVGMLRKARGPMDLVALFAHLPVNERVPRLCIINLAQFIQKAPHDHPQLPAAHFGLSLMCLIEEQTDYAKQLYDKGCEFDNVTIWDGTPEGAKVGEARPILDAYFLAKQSAEQSFVPVSPPLD